MAFTLDFHWVYFWMLSRDVSVDWFGVILLRAFWCFCGWACSMSKRWQFRIHARHFFIYYECEKFFCGCAFKMVKYTHSDPFPDMSQAFGHVFAVWPEDKKVSKIQFERKSVLFFSRLNALIRTSDPALMPTDKNLILQGTRVFGLRCCRWQ